MYANSSSASSRAGCPELYSNSGLARARHTNIYNILYNSSCRTVFTRYLRARAREHIRKYSKLEVHARAPEQTHARGGAPELNSHSLTQTKKRRNSAAPAAVPNKFRHLGTCQANQRAWFALAFGKSARNKFSVCAFLPCAHAQLSRRGRVQTCIRSV